MRDPLQVQWSGRVVGQARRIVGTWLPQPCGQCGRTVTTGDEWVVGHKRPRATHPELTLDVANWQPEHRACSNKSGQAVVIEKAKADALRSVGIFPAETPDGEPPPRPFSLPSRMEQPTLPGISTATTGKEMAVRKELIWNPERLEACEWLADFLEVPDDAAPPLYMTPPPADAVGSYGPAAIEWIERTQTITLRWWQRLAITRQLEHRDDGTLCAREIIESAPRRAGKSVRMRGVALWRMSDPLNLFGETQLVMHTGSDIPICREIQRGAWRWAESEWGSKAVTKANGKECIEDPATGNRWLVRSQDGVYGYDVTLGLVDEGWDVKPETVTEGIEPATLERVMPQIHLTSTAHRRATSLMRGRIRNALASDDPQRLLILWGAPAGSDIADPDVWRRASPHWTADRHQLISKKYQAALDGQNDPQADDPDPVAGFIAQYLNVWPLNIRAGARGRTVIEPPAWDQLTAICPDTTPAAAAIESWFADGVSLAVAWPVGPNVIVSVTGHDTLAEAATALEDHRYRGTVTVGASLAGDPDLARFATKPGEKRTAGAVHALSGLIRDGLFRHDGGTHLSEQVLAARVGDGADGPNMASKGRGDAIKTAVWAAQNVRTAPPKSTKLITATR